jgi:hypothetical protein
VQENQKHQAAAASFEIRNVVPSSDVFEEFFVFLKFRNLRVDLFGVFFV